MKLRRQFALITAITISLLVIMLFIVISNMVMDGFHEAAQFILQEGLIRNTLLVLVACGVAVLVVVVLAGEQLITQPLVEMSRDAKAIALNPEQGRRISIRGGDELATLGTALNSMLDALDNSRQQLLEARDEAESANRSKSDFLAVVSHELRTPLSGINGMTELLAETELNVDQRELLTSLQTSIEGLHDILNDILDLSKIEANRMELEPLPFAPRQLLATVLTPYQLQARRKGLSLDYRVAEECPEILVGDSGRLRQILLNLVVNALKFTHQGGITVDLSIASQESSRVELLVVVEDSGIGMSPETCARLFQPYTQADLATRREYGGTGLGLTITRRLTELMGGAIQVTSRLGSGSRFQVCIPFEIANGA